MLFVTGIAFLIVCLQGCGDASPRGKPSDNASVHGQAFLVESIPYDTDLQLFPGTRHTWEVLASFIDQARETIHFTAMYWSFVNTTGSSPEQRQQWGVDRGELVYTALWNAAKRGVRLRAICGIGLSSTAELEAIRQNYSEQVRFQLYNASEWYGGGIMHMKAWIFDSNRALITSSNTDWRSLTQVKEMGVALEGSPGFQVVKDLQLYFDRWWRWTDPIIKRSLKNPRMQVFDPYLQQPRFVPCFSEFGHQIPGTHGPLCQSPFNASMETVYNLANPMPLILNNTLGHTFLSCSPPEVCDVPDAIYSQFRRAPAGRTWDGDALVQTIMLAREHISVSVMDYVPSTMFDFCAGAWWPALNDALLAKLAQGLSVRLLISKWVHTLVQMESYLHALRTSAKAIVSGSPHPGSFQIRYFELPGWENATGPADEYPDYSRVNHAKYIVTDKRFNIGTSNMEWSYFHNTAGTSFNSDHPLLRAQLLHVFDRDWNSDYAKDFPPESSGIAQSMGRLRDAPDALLE